MHFAIAPNFPLPSIDIYALTDALLPATPSPRMFQQFFCLCPFVIFLLSSFLQIGLLPLSPHLCLFAPKKMSVIPLLTFAFPG